MSVMALTKTEVPTTGNRAQRRRLQKLLRRKGGAKPPHFHMTKEMVASELFKPKKKPKRVHVPKVASATRRRKPIVAE